MIIKKFKIKIRLIDNKIDDKIYNKINKLIKKKQ